jgi:hypothetical protein
LDNVGALEDHEAAIKRMLCVAAVEKKSRGVWESGRERKKREKR